MIFIIIILGRGACELCKLSYGLLTKGMETIFTLKSCVSMQTTNSHPPFIKFLFSLLIFSLVNFHILPILNKAYLEWKRMFISGMAIRIRDPETAGFS